VDFVDIVDYVVHNLFFFVSFVPFVVKHFSLIFVFTAGFVVLIFQHPDRHLSRFKPETKYAFPKSMSPEKSYFGNPLSGIDILLTWL